MSTWQEIIALVERAATDQTSEWLAENAETCMVSAEKDYVKHSSERLGTRYLGENSHTLREVLGSSPARDALSMH